MIDRVRAGLAVSKGLSIVCATCDRYWEGRERGLPEPKCAVNIPCGSALAGMDFPAYKGPITDLSRWCFVCGESATFGVTISGSSRVQGMCKAHIRMVGALEPVGINGKPISEIIHQGQRLSPEKFFKVPGKTLAQAIAEVESYYAGKEQG